MSRLTRDGTAEPVSRDQILRHARGQGNIIFPVQLTTSRIGNLTRLIHNTLLYVMTIHTYIHTYNYIIRQAGTPDKDKYKRRDKLGLQLNLLHSVYDRMGVGEGNLQVKRCKCSDYGVYNSHYISRL